MAFVKKWKIALYGVSAVVVLVVILGIILLSNMNTIATAGIERVLSYVLKVEVTLKSATISLLGGKITLEELTIGNPEGFNTAHAFLVDKISVNADLKSFATDKPRIHSIDIKSPQIVLEQGFKGSNLSTLIKNASSSETDKEAPPETQKKMKIDTLTVSNARVSLSAPVLQGKAISVSLPRIELNNLGGEKEYVEIAQSLALFLTAITKETLKAAKGGIPDDLEEMLSSSFDAAVEGIDNAGGILKKGADEVKERLDTVSDKIGGIFKKKKKE